MFMCKLSNKGLKFILLSKHTFYIYSGFRAALLQNFILKLFNLEQLIFHPNFLSFATSNYLV